MAVEIKKAKIVKDKHLSVLIQDETSTDVKDCNVEVHPDLRQSFANMGPHLAVMCGYVQSEDIPDIKKAVIDNFHVRAYSISKDGSGVVISGHHVTPDGKTAGLNTPFYRFDENPDTRYVFMDDLQDRLKRAEKEVRLYLYEGKKADDPQMSLDLKDKKVEDDKK